MPMNPNFLCCIGAELKNSTQQTTRMSQVYLYRSFEDDTLSDMLSAGFFNAAMGIIRQDDLLLLYSPNETTAKYTYARVSSVSSSGVIIERVGIEAASVSVDTTGYSNLSGNNLQEILNNLDTTITTINNAFVKKDGSSVMTGPLKFRAGSFVGAIAGGLGDGIAIYKLKSDNTIDSEVASLTKTNGFTPGTNNTQDIGSSSLKWKDLYIARVITAVLNNGANISVPTTSGTMALTSDIKDSTISVQLDGSNVDSFTLNQSSNKTINIQAANKDLSNLTSTGKNIGNWSSNVTNCITEIPQDIKLKLNNGTLTLKAGSKAYLPNGTTYSASQDVVLDNSQFGTATNDWVLAMTANNAIFPRNLANCVSGAGATTIAGFAYDTTTNVISWYNSQGSVGGTNVSFPIAIFHTTNGVPDRIDQVFNGFGYIGSTIFALPNIKGLAPDGRNADGTLKSVERTTATVLTATASAAYNNLPIGLGTILSLYRYVYDEQTNFVGGVGNGPVIIGTITTTTGGKITSFNAKPVFHALDYNDTDHIANQAMPSDRYIALSTSVSSGYNYTAPADGCLSIVKSGVAGDWLYMRNITNGLNMGIQYAGSYNGRLFVPVQKGHVIQVSFQGSGTVTDFRFIYANGSK